ncbi:MAG: uroporphyrinogen decarboxylase [Pseudomonadota bacterium]
MALLTKIFSGQKVEKTPCWLMRQSGRYLPEYMELRSKASNFVDFCLTPHIATEATLLPFQRYDFDAAIIFSDILIIPHALGQDVSFITGKGPQLSRLSQPSDLQALTTKKLPDVVAPVFEAIAAVRSRLPHEKDLIGFAGSPWTVACYMLEGQTSKTFSNAKTFAFKYPEAFQELLQLLVQATSDYLIQQVDAGAQVIQLFDSWASSVPEAQFDSWVVHPTRQIVSSVKARHPGVPIIGFPRGVGPLYLEYVSGTGVDGVSLDSFLPLKWALENLPNNVVLQGALDPQILVVGGALMEQEVKRQLALVAGRPHIFNLGHGIVPETPPEHVETLLDLVKAGHEQ